MAQWRYGLFSCFEECRICLISCFCAPCQIADIRATVLEEKQCGLTDLILPCLCAVCCSIKTRSDLRRKYNIGADAGQISLVEDIFKGWCCALCSLVQEIRECNAQGRPVGMFK